MIYRGIGPVGLFARPLEAPLGFGMASPGDAYLLRWARATCLTSDCLRDCQRLYPTGCSLENGGVLVPFPVSTTQ
jgi:hypothetical protein